MTKSSEVIPIPCVHYTTCGFLCVLAVTTMKLISNNSLCFSAKVTTFCHKTHQYGVKVPTLKPLQASSSFAHLAWVTHKAVQKPKHDLAASGWCFITLFLLPTKGTNPSPQPWKGTFESMIFGLRFLTLAKKKMHCSIKS